MRALHCVLFGCDFLRVYEPGRIYLRCQVCGTETEGLRSDYDDLPKPRVIFPQAVGKRFKVVKPRQAKKLA